MTTATVSSGYPLVDLAEWDADWSQREENYELVAGIPTAAPSEVFRNRRAGQELIWLLRGVLPESAVAVPDFDVQLSEVPPTVRCPDVVVLSRNLDLASRAMPHDVLLVAEVVSPSSAATDWLYKRREYAEAGIPLYLVIDVRDEARRMALFQNPTNGDYEAQSTDGSEATFTLGDAQVTVRLADLLA